jgi:lysine-N-methylase
MLHSSYIERFQCTGGMCEDTCCADWQIVADPKSVARYREIEPGPLRNLLDISLIAPMAGDPEGSMRLAHCVNGECPLLTSDRLCRIQVEKGESYLCRTCATYPRQTVKIDDIEETTLSLSCPEAARLILLDSNPIQSARRRGYYIDWDEKRLAHAPARAFIWHIRELLLNLIVDRRYALWQRLFLMGVFCRHLDEHLRKQPHRPMLAFLREFSSAIQSGALRPAMEQIPADYALQIDLLIDLIQLRAKSLSAYPRFLLLMQQFGSGIGLTSSSTTATLVPTYTDANRRWLSPFLTHHPQLFENLLIHNLYHETFPFHTALFDPHQSIDASNNFVRLATQFALIRGVLAGVAGQLRSEFNLDHALGVIVTFWRCFEHSSDFLTGSVELLNRRGASDVRNLTMLIRD